MHSPGVAQRLALGLMDTFQSMNEFQVLVFCGTVVLLAAWAAWWYTKFKFMPIQHPREPNEMPYLIPCEYWPFVRYYGLLRYNEVYKLTKLSQMLVCHTRSYRESYV
jgi:hypothetical protein